ncbi:Fe(3+)-hydroxamate ABC transporter permease FhuB [Phyllobacterium sp. YR531]|uniref:Fe(3+)-hydroxamate ABC transporter permease FhuB n=1 Tax=Phyllobacterium sp. YR531 TaxID=1144343 RepID=UPI00026F52B3|nr:Fe(3+)-hydroxamate ABC transporter permease FhuB [Phyllobacterium sp. YR531]EJN02488.1 ABC-type Fe3+-siderophore transport system, permease component [Phyllobacterium sp. YR531]
MKLPFALIQRRRLCIVVSVPALFAAILSFLALNKQLPLDMWWTALNATDLDDSRQLLFRHAMVPRVLIAPLIGAALGLTGAILQHVLRNPLAEPTTIGTNAGASLALTVATLYSPWLLEWGKVWITLAGGVTTTAIIFLLVARRGFSPTALIIAGLIISLTCSSASTLLMAINREYSEELFIWQSGSLVQNSDTAVIALVIWLCAGVGSAAFLLRPLILLELSDGSAQNLGAKPSTVRAAALGLAVLISTAVVAYAGVISFIALVAPALIRLAGARSLRQRLTFAPLAGASLLWLTDCLVQIVPFSSEIPTGTASAILGAPLLLVMIASLRTVPEQGQVGLKPSKRQSLRQLIPVGAIVFAVAMVIAFMVGRSSGGTWNWSPPTEMQMLLPLRGPRVLTALGCGAMLAMSGMLMQRMTTNVMAAPEVMGISGGATIGVLTVMFFTIGIDRPMMFAAALAGSFTALLLILLTSGRLHFSGDRLLLAGVSLATIASSFAALFIASGDQRIEFLLAWMSGSTYRSTLADAVISCATALGLLAVVPLTTRWLDIVPLGKASSNALGLQPWRVNLILIVLAAIPAGVATLLIGPLSFVGLMAPHLARVMGFHRALPQIYVSAFLGGIILICADWLGRMLLFPWQIPAGLLAAFIGGPYFLILMLKKQA